MQMRNVLIAGVLALSAQGLMAQSPNASAPAPKPVIPKGPKLTGSTPGECLKQGNDWYSAEYVSVPVAERGPRRAGLIEEQRRIIRECAAGFNVSNTKLADLADLHVYYRTMGDTLNASAALDRALENGAKLPQRTYAKVLHLATDRAYTRAVGRSYFGILNEAEPYVERLDALPDSLDDEKISVHNSMLAHYDYLDVADGLRNHANALIALGRKNHQPLVMINAFAGLARSEADKLHPDVALKILDDAEKELSGTPQVVEAFRDFRNRYALIGTQAPAITGKWWVNSPPRDSLAPGDGKVTLIEFTAHWCGPCKNSYPGLRKVAATFNGKPFQGVMATGIYGYLGTRRPLTPEQEVEADNDYFGKEHALPFPVAINVDGPVLKPGDYGPMLDRSYRVSGIPQIMIVDKHGIIRQIVTGWDQGNTDRFISYIETLLAEN